MFAVISTHRGKRPKVYGPFKSPLAAADWAREHQDEALAACEVTNLLEPIVYGEEGL